MKPKERGWVLAIDQASNAAGVSLWYSGELKATKVLKSVRATDPIAKRLQDQVPQLTALLNAHLLPDDQIGSIIFEGVRARLVLITVGAFLTCPRVRAKVSPKDNFVESRSWKKYAKERGATAPIKDVKGVRALREIGFPVDQHAIESDDVADSILIYLTWRDKPG